MKIAQIAPLGERVPPYKYGGTERVIHDLTESLVKRGHEVTLFASGDSLTSAKLQSVFPKSLREARVKDPYGVNEWNILNIGFAYKQAESFDIIHDHSGVISLPAANFSPVPVVMTVHSPINKESRAVFQELNKPYLVGISNAQRKDCEELNFIDTVYNGLDFSDFYFEKEHEDYLLFVGRICKDKGVHLAIEASLATGLPLIIVAKLDDVNRDYFKKKVKPFLDGKKIKWVGELTQKERNKLFAGAKALLHPVTWPEPFGLAMIEAMASACPVIAFDEGSVSELIVSGKTGFVVKTVREMVESIAKIDTISRERTRLHSLTNFNSEKMADGYERVYQKILTKNGKKDRKLELLLADRLPSRKRARNL